ncbi:DUF4392 domain-containing protein [[Clostridium] hylemonae]|uniref:DUF4392 domain-containing protein n=1 Tax=[Clostridium] hylemonae TaxID=89153 RepID=UPI001FCC0AA1|nr:DUF4392 domain-containing protein [[Clostridium] hylemonae]BDF03029.1 hypothetical protein CE91St63_00910 [[Clostridium] hylemonae]
MDSTAKRRTETVEDVVLRYSCRGMHILRTYMDAKFCRKAALKLLSLEKGTILLTTGFYVDGHAETDGPPGTMALAVALRKLGYHPVIVTDKYCRGFFEMENLEVKYMNIDDGRNAYENLLETYRPAALISIERCGRNEEKDYANMRGTSIKSRTARVDLMFEKAAEMNIPTFGIGDGGNEIGMGNLKEVIRAKLSLVPCEVEVDTLVISTVSNWGAYALAAYMQQIKKIRLLPKFKEIKKYLEAIVKMGSVDGVTKRQALSVDGFPLEVEKEILDALNRAALQAEEEIERKAG